MRTFLILLSFLLAGSVAIAQTCINNPSVQSGNLNPAPLYPNATGVYSFTYFENLQDYAGWQTDPITITLCMLHIGPQNGANSVSGTCASWFNWIYDPGSNCLQGTQNQTILGGTGGTIEVDFAILNPVNCGGSNQMGFNVNLQVAACMTGVNEQSDDTESVYTCYDPNGGTSSIEEKDELNIDISLFPNPASKHITVDINSELPSQNANLVITDVLGRSLKTVKNKMINQGENSYKLNIRSLATGTYFLTVESKDGNQQATVKFIKADD